VIGVESIVENVMRGRVDHDRIRFYFYSPWPGARNDISSFSDRTRVFCERFGTTGERTFGSIAEGTPLFH